MGSPTVEKWQPGLNVNVTKEGLAAYTSPLLLHNLLLLPANFMFFWPLEVSCATLLETSSPMFNPKWGLWDKEINKSYLYTH